MKELSVVVLAYKAEEYIITFLNQLFTEVRQLNIDYEFIVVANYDKGAVNSLSVKLTEEFGADENILIVAKEKNGRMGWDMRSGLDAATGKYICVIDGDGQMPASDIPVVYRIIKQDQFDLVKTYRQVRYDGLYRITLSKFYNVFFNLLYVKGIWLNDVNSKPKIFTREAYMKMNLVSNDWFTDAEIMIHALKMNLKICEVGTVFYKKERQSSLVDISTIFEFIYNLIKYKLK